MLYEQNAFHYWQMATKLTR